jgi:predicted Zn-dependent protease
MKRTAIAATLLPLLAACGGGEAKLTESQEYYAGRAVSAVAIKKYKLLDNEALTNYVNLVGYTCVGGSKRDAVFKGYTFLVLDAPEPNAIAAPSGFIFITRGLLEMLKNEDELACVLAHEIGHVAMKHPEKALDKALSDQKYLEAASTGAGVASGIAGILGRKKEASYIETAKKNFGPFVKNIVDGLFTKGYERDQEFEADLVGLDNVVHPDVGYNPAALADVLKRMADTPARQSYGWMHGSTHPEPADRLTRINAYLKEKGYIGTTDPARTKRFEEAMKALKK